MIAPRRGLQAPSSWAGLRQWIGTSWVPAALAAALCLSVAGFWPALHPTSAPLPVHSGEIRDDDLDDQRVAGGSTTQEPLAEDTRGPEDGSSQRRPGSEPGSSSFRGPMLVMSHLGIAAPLDLVGVDADELEIPDDPSHVGIWEDGARPGDASGTVLITGHVSWNGTRGALWPLAASEPGDVIEVVDDTGAATHWLVSSAKRMERDADHPALFTRHGRLRLVLVTCGGPVVDGNYRDLVVVEAVPA